MVRINKIQVNNYVPASNSVDLTIFFNDGSEKQVSRTISIEETDKISMQLFTAIKQIEHASFEQFDGEKIVTPFKTADEARDEELMKKLRLFFEDIRAKANHIRTTKSAEGYLQLINSVHGSTLDL
jgi:hypothetical protein